MKFEQEAEIKRIECLNINLLEAEHRTDILSDIVREMLSARPQATANVIEHHLRKNHLAEKYHNFVCAIGRINLSNESFK